MNDLRDDETQKDCDYLRLFLLAADGGGNIRRARRKPFLHKDFFRLDPSIVNRKRQYFPR